MRARSAVFDLYGDHLRDHGHWAPVAAVISLLDACDIRAGATRTAVSRMVAQGWLVPQQRAGIRGYAATGRAKVRLEAAHARIFRRGPVQWDRQWHLVIVPPAVDRSTRDRMAATLGYLGYGRLSTQTWVAAHHSPELGPALDRLGITPQEFTGVHLGDPVALAARVWDLSGLARAHTRFLTDTDQLAALMPSLARADRAYPARAELVHRWRTFLFTDPGLPEAVLPKDWPEPVSRARFLHLADALEPGARRFLTQALASAGAVKEAHSHARASS